jgi:predicted PurR-regulated permease PerM
MHLSFQRIFYAIATVFSLFAIMIVAKSILIPLGFALVLSFILLPLANRFQGWGMGYILAAFLSLLSVFVVIAGIFYFFSTQIIQLANDFGQFKEKILLLFADVTTYINSNIPFVPNLERGELISKTKTLLNESAGTLASQTFSGTTTLLTGVLTTVIFTFLLLIYRKGLTHAFTRFYTQENRPRALKLFKSIQNVGQKYLYGMFLIILILGFVNSIGLLIIGIDNPFLFGFLASILAIIPYVGTTLGAAIPVVYTLVSYDSIWMTIAVFLLFWLVQIIESNFLSPKIVGGSLKVNALTAILSILIGASVWGVAGMILFLPFSAMLKVICAEYKELEPIAMILSDFEEKPSKEKTNEKTKFGNQMVSKIKSWFSK